MNVVSGRVVVKESGVGVPDLLVVVYDVDPGTRSEDEADDRGGGIGDRLGSRLTDAAGTGSPTLKPSVITSASTSTTTFPRSSVTTASNDVGYTHDA